MIELPGKRLEIDVRRIHMHVKIAARYRIDIPRRNRHRHDPAFVGRLRVNRILGENHRIVVLERDTAAADTRRGFRRFFG